MSIDTLKTITISIVSIIGGLFVIALALHYSGNFIRRMGNTNGGMSFPVIIGILAGTTLLIWGLLYAFRPVSGANLAPAKGSLNKVNSIGNARQVYNHFYNGMGGGSFGVYVYLDNFDRTPRSTGQLPLLSIGPCKLFVNNNKSTTTYATINVSNNQSEEIQLDDFPLQKWVYLTVNREGRRFTFYYNGVVAGSKVIDRFYTKDTSAVKLGNVAYVGRYLYPNLNSTALRETDIQAHIRATADSKGRPIEKIEFMELIFGTGSLFCSGGSCTAPLIEAPSGYKFQTPFQ
jgi:hypothetical protein